MLVVGSETPQTAMNDPGRREDPSSLPSSGTQVSGDGTERAEDNAGVPSGTDCSGIPQGCEGKDNERTLVEKAALVEKPPHDPEGEKAAKASSWNLYPLWRL